MTAKAKEMMSAVRTAAREMASRTRGNLGRRKALERRIHFSRAALEGSLPSLEPRRQDGGPVGVWLVLGPPHT